MEMTKKVGASSLVDQIITSTNLLYSAEVMAMPLPPKFRIPQIDLYDGSWDLLEYLNNFNAHMTLHRFLGKIACRTFPLTLKGATLTWFVSLALNSICNFENLTSLFITQFMASRKRRRPPMAQLLIVKLQEDESLKLYLTRFNKEQMSTDVQYEKISLLGGIWARNLFIMELARKNPTTLREFIDQVDGFINVENMLQVLTTPRRKELEQVDRKAKTSAQSKVVDKAKRGYHTKGKMTPTTQRGSVAGLIGLHCRYRRMTGPLES